MMSQPLLNRMFDEIQSESENIIRKYLRDYLPYDSYIAYSARGNREGVIEISQVTDEAWIAISLVCNGNMVTQVTLKYEGEARVPEIMVIPVHETLDVLAGSLKTAFSYLAAHNLEKAHDTIEHARDAHELVMFIRGARG